MKKTARKSGFACRFSGEEFIPVMPHANAALMVMRAEAARNAIRNLTVFYGGPSIGPVTVSIGIAVFSPSGTTSELVIDAADEALYQAKINGCHQVAVSSSAT